MLRKIIKNIHIINFLILSLFIFSAIFKSTFLFILFLIIFTFIIVNYSIRGKISSLVIIIITILPFLDLTKQLYPNILNLMGSDFYLGGIIKDIISIYLYFLFFILFLSKKIKIENNYKALILFSLAYFFWSIISMIRSPNLFIGLWGVRNYIEFYPIFLLIIYFGVINIRDYFFVFLLVLSAIIMLGLIRYFIDPSFLYLAPEILNVDQTYPYFEEFKLRRLTAASLNPNESGILISLGIISIIGYKWKKTGNYLKFILLFLSILCLFITTSRSAWIGLILSTVFLLTKTKRKIISGSIILIFVLLMLLSPIFKYRFYLIAQGDPRLINWGIAFKEILSNYEYLLIGKGTGIIGNKFPITDEFSTLDNFYLHLWYEQGLIGILIFLTFVINIITLYKRKLNENENFIYPISLLVCLLISNLFSPTLITPWGQAIFWLLGSLAKGNI
jgi:hypothetical protein